MPIVSWPSTLPQQFMIRTFEETFPDPRLRTEMDAGPAKVRRRTSAAVGQFRGEMAMELTQLGILKEFYTQILVGGTKPFRMPYPHGTDAGPAFVDLRFTEVPTWRRVADLAFVTIDCEVLP